MLGLAAPAQVPRAAADEAPDLSGIWEVTGDTRLYGHFRFFVDMQRMRFSDGRPGWEAIKRTDTRNVPAREVHFRGYVDTLRYNGITRHLLFANVQVAFPGFLSPRMEEHIFEVSAEQARLATQVSSVILDSVDARGNETLGTDRWVYKKWDLRTFQIAAPQVRDYAFAIEANRLRQEIAENERDLETLSRRMENREAELARIIADDRTGEQAARLLREKNAALERFMQAQRPAAAEPPPVPQPLRRMNEHLAFLKGEKTSVEDRIVALNRAQPAERDRLFARLAGIEQQIADTEAAMRRIAREEGVEIPKDGAPTPSSPEALAVAERAYQDAFRRWYEQDQRNRARPDRVNDLNRELTELRARQSALQEAVAEKGQRMKGYENGRQISGIIVADEQGTVNGASIPGSTILEVVPSDIDLDLTDMREQYEKLRDEFQAIEKIRSDNLARFNAVSDEITALREELISVIRSSAYKQAAVELVGNLASAAISGATGGLASAAVDAVFTVAWTCAWNEDCVAFTNYDETAMQKVFDDKRDELLAEHPLDENATCSFLPDLEPVDGQNRLPAWAREPQPGETQEPLLRAIEVSGNTAQRANIHNGTMTVLSGTGMSAREGTLIAGERQFRVWYQGRIRDMLVQMQANVAMREAQMRAIRQSLGRASRQVAWDEASHAARSAMVAAARHVLSDPNASTAAAARAQRILQEIWPKVQEAELLGRIDVKKGFERFEALDRTIKEQTEELAKLEGKLAKLSGSFKQKLALAGLNVVAGIAIGLTKSAFQERFKEQERDHWARVFAKQIEASVYFRAYQRASCLYWTRLDQIAWLQRLYAPLYFAYDQNKDLQVLTDHSFSDDQSLLVFVSTRNGDFSLGSRTTIGGIACRRISATACRIGAEAWVNLRERRPTLEFVVDLEPRRE